MLHLNNMTKLFFVEKNLLPLSEFIFTRGLKKACHKSKIVEEYGLVLKMPY